MTLEAAAASASYGTTASGSSFYAAMRILPREQREAMFQIYSFCRKVDDIADSDGPAARAAGGAAAMARRYRRALPGPSAAAAAAITPPRCKEFGLEARGFPGDRRWHGNGRAAGYPGAGSCDARSLLRSRGERRRAALGSGVRSARRRRHPARASSRPRAAIDQYPARHRRGRRASAGFICRARHCCTRGITSTDPLKVVADPALPKVCPPLVARAQAHFEKADEIMAPQSTPCRCARRGSCQNIIGQFWTLLVARGFASPRSAGPREQDGPDRHRCFATPSSDAKNRPHHRRRNFGPVGRRPARERELSRCMSTRPRSRRAGAAALISMPRPT